MRILYVITELDIGGAERTLYRLAAGAKKEGHEVEVACLTGEGEIGRWLSKEGISVHYFHGTGKRPWCLVLPLWRLARRNRPDVLHSFLFHANMAGRLAGWLAQVPVVISSVRVEDVERKWRLRLDGWTSWMMQMETCVSESARSFTQRASGISGAKLITIPNGVDPEAYDLEPGMFRAELGLVESDALLVTAGRLEKQKGITYLLDALPIVHERFPSVHLCILGAGPDESEVRNKAALLPCREAVHFLGWRRDVPQALVDADVFVLTSLWEGMPNVVLEAMAARCPVVGTDVGGIPEMVVDGQTGRVVAPARPELLAEAIIGLLEEPGRMAAMGEAGRRRVEASFSVETMVAANLALYERLLPEVHPSLVDTGPSGR